MPNALPTDFPLFSSDEDDTKEESESPSHWMRKLEHCFPWGTADADKIHEFTLSLEPNSTTEIWWDAIGQQDKDTWLKVTTVFKLRWPGTKAVATSATTKRELMRELKLAESDVGKIVGEGKKKNHAHIVWANKVETLWRQMDD